ncbi:MAG: 4-hydroxy-tetrahydrodipicolinate synthase [Lachnospiraceae bacterium]|nr:4-hydroxy-tetrahydrodipicolinate synthase [Lachnospiraceae bacterium]
MAIFEGAGVALVTPFHDDFTVNYEKLEELIEMQIAGGTDAIIIVGSTGEPSTLSIPDHLLVVKRCIEIVNKRIPVIAGTGSNSTETAIGTTTEAVKLGADGCLLVTPYYNKATQKGLVHHYTTIAKEVPSTPLILYNVPSRTGLNMMPETVAELVKTVPNIVGLKDATGNIAQTARMMNYCDGKLDLYSGNDDCITAIMSLGGKGVISVLSNIAPAQTKEIVMSYLRGDVKKSAKMQLEAMPLIDALFCEVNPIPVKGAMNLMGLGVGPLRSPLSELESQHVELMRKELEAYGLL